MISLSARARSRNQALFVLEYICFSLGLTFLSPTVVLPALIRLLGGSSIAVGSLGAIQTGAWLLPQLVAGRYVAGRPWVKRYAVLPAAVSRLSPALLLPILAFGARRAPGLVVLAVLGVLTCFCALDALSGVAWYDLFAKAVPLERRGRLLGTAQVLSGLLAVGAGTLIGAILARPAPFPANHQLLALLSSLCFGVSLLALISVTEPPGVAHSAARLGWPEYIPRLRLIWRSDRRFVWLTLTRWLAGLADMGGPFYVLYAADRLRLPSDVIGLFVSAGVVGTLLCGALLGPLGDRRGSAAVIRVVMGLRCLTPALALLAPLLACIHPWVAGGGMALVFVAIGTVSTAFMIGFSNYVLEIAPAGERSLYVALANTLAGLLVLAPLLAGVVLRLASYEALFALALGLAVLGFTIAVRGPEALRLGAQG